MQNIIYTLMENINTDKSKKKIRFPSIFYTKASTILNSISLQKIPLTKSENNGIIH